MLQNGAIVNSVEVTQPAASEPGPSTPLPAKRCKRTKAESAAEPTKGKGKAAKAKPVPQPGRWRPLKLCYWPEQGALPTKGKEYPELGYKWVRDKPPKAQNQHQHLWHKTPFCGGPRLVFHSNEGPRLRAKVLWEDFPPCWRLWCARPVPLIRLVPSSPRQRQSQQRTVTRHLQRSGHGSVLAPAQRCRQRGPLCCSVHCSGTSRVPSARKGFHHSVLWELAFR
ncbi:hypothetical protein HaLaN_16719 [Haematococcus lacustris]|uniref:Uncharacterized protein n=1 Tax=Haematococcus lacustris TaxID=44745 RepID=A0A699ZC82_HAELA|nr:hypothetical protein HaLaN_16719 [Haematococcus lacustris]